MSDAPQLSLLKTQMLIADWHAAQRGQKEILDLEVYIRFLLKRSVGVFDSALPALYSEKQSLSVHL